MMSPFAEKKGARSSAQTERLDAERVFAFAQAVSPADGPLTGVPPTFPTCFRKGEFELFQILGIPLAAVLHAEQEYNYERTLHVGEIVSYDTVLESVAAKKEMTFLTFVTQIVDATQSAVATNKTVIVVRGLS